MFNYLPALIILALILAVFAKKGLGEFFEIATATVFVAVDSVYNRLNNKAGYALILAAIILCIIFKK